MNATNKMNVTSKEINNATIEAIYWWNRSESYFHRYFSKIDELYSDEELFRFFTQKVFETFLKDYSIRRNISKGFKSVDSFLKELKKHDFFKKVKSGNTDIIDLLSGKLKVSGKSTKKGTKSLLSKIAYFINPNVYALYDTQAKNAVWKIMNDKKGTYKKSLETYSGFHKQILKIQSQLNEAGLFKQPLLILGQYKNTDAYSFYKANPNAFQLRMVDKFLWIKGANKDSREINNEQYKKFLAIK